ncbi:MAG: aminoacyl-tRNA hydrolase [Bdellovibrionales bacterium]
MKLIVGLGNPGPKYALTRHNIGFMMVDALATRHDSSPFKNEFKAETKKIKMAEEPVILCKPQTFMNLSGEAIQPLMKFYNLELSDLLVIHDEVDIPYGHIRFHIRRGHGGHNGIRNIHQLLGTDDYARLKMGVGRPPVFVNDKGEKSGTQMDVADWVLQSFSKSELDHIPDFLVMAEEAIETWIRSGIGQASTKFNSAKLEMKEQGKG